METIGTFDTVEQMLAPYATEIKRANALNMNVYLPADKLVPAVKSLREAQWGYLSAITGLDHPGEPEGSIETLYQFCNRAEIVTLRVSVPYSAAVLPSVCGLIPTATLYEREMIEMFGVTIEGTPNTDKLLLPDDWPDGVYPLRKSFTGLDNTPQA